MLRTALLTSCLGLVVCAGALTSAPAAAQERGWNDSSITCSSKDNRRRECDTPFRGRAALVENISGTRCIEGRNWGSERGRVWVDNGCRGRFVEARGGWGGNSWGGDDRPGNLPTGTVRCESRDRRQVVCDTGWRRAMIVRQLSGTACVEGRNWHQDNGRIWVDDGCRADFAPARGGRGWDRDDDGRPGDRPRPGYAITCSSDDRRLRTCQWDDRAGYPVPTRQLSDTRCEEGRTWGYDRRRAVVWVNDGCRARFEAR